MQRRAKRPLLAKIAAFALLIFTGSFALSAPAYAEDPPPVVDPVGSISGACVGETFVLTASGSAGTFAATAYIGVNGVEVANVAVDENTPFSFSYNVTLAEDTAFTADLQFGDIYGTADVLDSESFTIDCVAPDPDPDPDPDYGIAGTPYPNSSDSNKPGYWEDAGPHDDAICYKHEGEEMWDNDHAYLTNDGKTVVLKPYGATWPGDHYEAIIVKAANTDLVTIHPVAGLPGYSAVDNKEVSHYIVCKGTTPPPPPTPPTGTVYAVCTLEGLELNWEGTAGTDPVLFRATLDDDNDGTFEEQDASLTAAGENYLFSMLADPTVLTEGTVYSMQIFDGDTLLEEKEFTVDCVDDPPPPTPSVCTEETILPMSTNLNPRGAVLSANASYVDSGLLLESDNWVDAYVTFATNFELKDARNFFMDITVANPGSFGYAPIFHTSLGNIHGEELYSDELWTNSPGILPATGGGQGGSYSGSLEDALAIGNPTVTSVTFLFTSATANSAILSQGGYNCLIQPFDYEAAPTTPPVDTPKETLAATGQDAPIAPAILALLAFLVGAAILTARHIRRINPVQPTE